MWRLPRILHVNINASLYLIANQKKKDAKFFFAPFVIFAVNSLLKKSILSIWVPLLACPAVLFLEVYRLHCRTSQQWHPFSTGG